MKPQQMEPGRRDEHAELLDQLQRIEHQVRGAVPSGVGQLVQELTPGAFRQPLHCQGNLLEAGFPAKYFGDRIHCLVDLHHLMEKLGAAARVVYGPAADETLSRWKLTLLNRQDAAPQILGDLVASGQDEGPGENHPVHAAITYLESHSVSTDRMNYARARRLGLPLGSGNVEATCKSLFEMRLKRCGSRWKDETGQHIVQLRALALSDRWGPAVELVLRPLRMAVRAA